MSNNILVSKLNLMNIVRDWIDSLGKIGESILFKASVVLLNVSRYDHLGAFAKTRQEHLHLGRGRVLHLVPYDPRVLECTTPHVSQRTNLDIILDIFWIYVL